MTAAAFRFFVRGEFSVPPLLPETTLSLSHRGDATCRVSTTVFACGLFVSALLLLAPGRTLAQVDTLRASTLDTTLALPRVTVTARAASVTPAEAPARLTRIGPQALQASGVQNVGRLLAERSGAFVKSYGGGQLATLSMRGAGAAQTLVQLNGHAITSPQLGQLDLSLLPTSLLRAMEVRPGGGSALHGAGALGGVVNLRTQRPGKRAAATVTGEYGAFGKRTGRLALTGSAAGVGGLVVGEYATTNGDYPYLDESHFPSQTVRRRNADRTRRSLFGAFDVRAAEPVQLQVGGWYQRTERGLPPIGSARARQWDRHLRLWADATWPRSWGALHLGGLVQRTALRHAQQGLDQTGRTLTATLRGSADIALAPRWRLRSGLESSFSRARHPQLAGDARRGHASLFARATGRYGAVRLFPALRLDGYAETRNPTRLAVSPQLGLNWQLISALHLKARAGRAFRMPTFNDRYWQPGGNPDLRPERSWNAEAGLFAGDARRHAEVTVYARRTRDKIVWRDTGGYWSPINVGRTRALGLEASLESRWALGPLAGRGGLFYTLTDARNRAAPNASTYNEQLRYVPRHKLKSHLTVGLSPAALDLDARYVGRRYVTSDGGSSLNPYLVAGAQLRLAWQMQGARFRLAGRLNNALGTRYEVLDNRPMPPRHAQVRLSISTGP
jgi:iron complex outermembrane receptor protein